MPKGYSPNLKKMPLSSLLASLSDPVRLEILKLLLENEEISCGDCKFGRSKATMSHHFRVLRETGLIQRREEGTIHYISLRYEEIEARLPGFLDMFRKVSLPF